METQEDLGYVKPDRETSEKIRRQLEGPLESGYGPNFDGLAMFVQDSDEGLPTHRVRMLVGQLRAKNYSIEKRYVHMDEKEIRKVYREAREDILGKIGKLEEKL
jgi:hypothetical protein